MFFMDILSRLQSTKFAFNKTLTTWPKFLLFDLRCVWHAHKTILGLLSSFHLENCRSIFHHLQFYSSILINHCLFCSTHATHPRALNFPTNSIAVATKLLYIFKIYKSIFQSNSMVLSALWFWFYLSSLFRELFLRSFHDWSATSQTHDKVNICKDSWITKQKRTRTRPIVKEIWLLLTG